MFERHYYNQLKRRQIVVTMRFCALQIEKRLHHVEPDQMSGQNSGKKRAHSPA